MATLTIVAIIMLRAPMWRAQGAALPASKPKSAV
jgi:hypothetical protein